MSIKSIHLYRAMSQFIIETHRGFEYKFGSSSAAAPTLAEAEIDLCFENDIPIRRSRLIQQEARAN